MINKDLNMVANTAATWLQTRSAAHAVVRDEGALLNPSLNYSMPPMPHTFSVSCFRNGQLVQAA